MHEDSSSGGFVIKRCANEVASACKEYVNTVVPHVANRYTAILPGHITSCQATLCGEIVWYRVGGVHDVSDAASCQHVGILSVNFGA